MSLWLKLPAKSKNGKNIFLNLEACASIMILIDIFTPLPFLCAAFLVSPVIFTYVEVSDEKRCVFRFAKHVMFSQFCSLTNEKRRIYTPRSTPTLLEYERGKDKTSDKEMNSLKLKIKRQKSKFNV